jgi:hypothetical protein
LSERNANAKKSPVYYIRDNGDKYAALYGADGTLKILENVTKREDIPANTKTFRMLADGNRGNKFTPA